MEKRTYLTRLAGPDERTHTRYPCRLKGRVYYVKRGLKGVSFQGCRITNISAAGCLLHPMFPSHIQSHFYLELEDLHDKLASAIVDVSKLGFHVEFQTLLQSDVVDRLAGNAWTRTVQTGHASAAGHSAMTGRKSPPRAT